MSSERGKLSQFLGDVINWSWKDFCEAEKDPQYTGLEATVLALVRTTSEGKLGAIRLAIDRIDGKIETPVRIVAPKVYFIYPHATSVAGAPTAPALAPGTDSPPETSMDIIEPPEVSEDPAKLATMTLRDTLSKMADSPRQVVPLVLHRKKQIENGEDVEPVMVKSVIAANLLHLATEKNNFEAITEVFDQIEGKLVETIHLLGSDMYLEQYAEIAPAGAVKNELGIYQMEAEAAGSIWDEKLRSKLKS